MKSFFSNTIVHVIIVGIFGLATQLLTTNGYDSLTIGVIVHGIYEWVLAKTA